MNNGHLVKNIKTLCKQQNMSVSQLENILNFSPGLISRWIKTTPSLERLVDISKFFNVSIDRLIGNEIDISYSIKKVEKNSLIETILHKTINSGMEWEILNFNKSTPLLQYINPLLSEEKEYDCFYSVYENGYFVLLSSHLNNNVSLSLFILPDRHSKLLLQCNDNEQLYELYKSILNKLEDELINSKAEQFINKFMNSYT